MCITFCRQYVTGGQHRQVLILIALQSHTFEEDQELQRQEQLEWHRIRQQQQKLDTQSSGADPATCDFMGPSRRALLLSELNDCESNNTTDRRQGKILPLRALRNFLKSETPVQKYVIQRPTTREFWDRIVYRDT